MTVTRLPPILSPAWIADARRIATETAWFTRCREARCQAECACLGRLRAVGGGPRCYPGCLADALPAILTPGEASEAERERLFGLLDLTEPGDADSDEVPPGQLLLVVLDLLSVAPPEPRLGPPRGAAA